MSHAVPIRVLLVDKHPAVRRGLRHLLCGCPDLDVIDEVADGAAALASAADAQPDLILLDTCVCRVDHVRLIELLRQVAPVAHIILLTTGDESIEQRVPGQTCRADAYLPKHTADVRLIDTIRSLCHGEQN